MNIDNNLSVSLEKEAILSDRKRKNFNLHKTANYPIPRMINVLQPESYIQPHKHENPDKREYFLF